MKTYETLKQPCSHCPFQAAKHGTEHEHGYYDPERADTLWNGGLLESAGELFPPVLALKNGARQMTCHRTGETGTNGHAVIGPKTRACCGALTCQHREVLRAHEHGTRYRTRFPAGMELRGVLRVAETMMGRSLSWHEFLALDRRELIDHATKSITDTSIGLPGLSPPTFEERTSWSS